MDLTDPHSSRRQNTSKTDTQPNGTTRRQMTGDRSRAIHSNLENRSIRMMSASGSLYGTLIREYEGAKAD